MKNLFVLILLFSTGTLSSGFISSSENQKVLKTAFVTNEDEPTMVFPVAGKKAWIGSFWGAVRDGGKRKHEGIDIFAKKRTPVVAVTNGIVTAVTNGGIGGKTVWLRSLDNNFTYYYAHLDQQSVIRGEIVEKGQKIGTVGNTGNAKLTPPHLHFGIYTYSGAIDPLPYVKKSTKIVLPVKEATASSKTVPRKGAKEAQRSGI